MAVILVWLLLGVHSTNMLDERRLQAKALLAFVTLERFLASVDEFMSVQIAPFCERLVAIWIVAVETVDALCTALAA